LKSICPKSEKEIEYKHGCQNEALFSKIQELTTKFQHEKEQLAKNENVNLSFIDILNKDVSEVKEKLINLNKLEDKMTKIIEQTNILMMKDANQGEKLSKLEKNQTDVNNKLSNLESADVFLQEANRMLIEKVSNMEENLKHVTKKEADEKSKETEKLVHNIDRQLKDLNVEIVESKKNSDLLKTNIYNLDHKVTELKDTFNVEEIEKNSKQILDLKRLIGEQTERNKWAEKEILQIKEANEGIEQNVNKMVETKQEIDNFEEYKTEVAKKFVEMNQEQEKISDQYFDNFGKCEEDLRDVKKCMESDQDLLVKKVLDQKKSLDSFFSSIEDKFNQLEKTQTEEMKHHEKLKLKNIEQDLKLTFLEQLADRIETIEQSRDRECEEKVDEIKAGSCMGFGNQHLWTLILEIYSVFRGYTLVVRSEGAVSEHQSDVLGVYRMVDSYHDRPVYKQEGGENYIYYSSASASWLVGCVVGQQYGWLRNSSSAAASARWLPDLRSGWEYKPLVRTMECLGDRQESWLADDGTLRIEALRDVDKIHSLIKEMKRSQDVE